MLFKDRRLDLGPSLLEGLGIFALAFFGSEVLFAPSAEGVGLAATLVPAVAAGLIAFMRRLVRP